ncbi:uncharacterized protein TRIVIDRAFT_53145 [Trichoderma virens Gv29-8]|uniref:Terpene synthase n=1 Tax=Hypocrea virens (strain Gv29-8 / FGSC 10586) TaxID=413071 RepID=G9MUQ3_HYPVG|nr:uncharacterized protein TRIVIDRAFT_53145 [Trichoderma virens Gv29-8]EHK21849.1 hypothetical protein TRIVIDRAFT_53145 [Trichoderma virens Gv29-8]UKZ54343.1 hypothetical protein TrVGV298_008151 [Trichoderma virens]UKZ80115.1 hypothetical protein TrVFT333_007880 [Trichoderma virens FT-333]
MGSLTDPREELLAKMKSCSIVIPELQPMFTSWPAAVNPEWKNIVSDMNARISSLYSDPVKVAKLQSCDFALFASAWWPRAPREQLRILAYLAFWLFIWDDEIDESTGALSNNFVASEKYRLDTMHYVAQTLGLHNTSDTDSNKHGFVPLNAIIRSFDVIGEALSQAYNIEQRKRFLQEMDFFIQKAQVEQKSRLDGRILSLEEYWDIRMGTSAVGVIMAVNEFSANVRISDAIMDHPDMRILWDESNINVSM